jgi:tetratricopeptide (TPR) repeat protein
MHPLLQQYAAEKLKATANWMETTDRHLAYFLARAEEAESHYQGSDQLLWLDRLEMEHDNLIVALHWAWEQGKMEFAARLSGALGWFWGIRGYLSEGKRWLSTTLSCRQQLPVTSLAQVLFASGLLAFEQGDNTQAKQHFDESLALWREVDDEPRIADLLNQLGHVAQQQGEFVRTRLCYEESLALYQKLDDKSGIALSLNRLGHLAQLEANEKEAEQFLEESLALRQELGDKRGMASSLNALAEIARYQGDYQRASSLYEESLGLCRQLGDKRCVAGVCHNLGHIAERQGKFGLAVALFKESLNLFQELQNQGGVALCLAGLAAVLGAKAKPERATQLFGASKALLAANSTLLSPTDQQAWAQNLALVQGQLDDTVFATSYARGQAMSLDQAIKYALTFADEDLTLGP